MVYMLHWDHIADKSLALDTKTAKGKDVVAVREHVKAHKLCYLCCRRLQAIGKARQNGANHRDWLSRHYHKACWKEIMLAKRKLCGCGTERIVVSREMHAFVKCDCAGQVGNSQKNVI